MKLGVFSSCRIYFRNLLYKKIFLIQNIGMEFLDIINNAEDRETYFPIKGGEKVKSGDLNGENTAVIKTGDLRNG
jgi:hypothetical protein